MRLVEKPRIRGLPTSLQQIGDVEGQLHMGNCGKDNSARVQMIVKPLHHAPRIEHVRLGTPLPRCSGRVTSCAELEDPFAGDQDLQVGMCVEDCHQPLDT